MNEQRTGYPCCVCIEIMTVSFEPTNYIRPQFPRTVALEVFFVYSEGKATGDYYGVSKQRECDILRPSPSHWWLW